MASENNDGDEDFLRAFGEHTYILREMREDINQIKSNDPFLEDFHFFGRYAAETLSNQAWELLGSYIASNVHLKKVSFASALLTDEKTSKLFERLTGSKSLKTMNLSGNGFGLDGIQSMVPLLKSSSLTKLEIGNNRGINTDGFRLLINALHGGSIEVLSASDCTIEDTLALEGCSLPHLKELNLADNNVQIIPSLEKYTNLEKLQLQRNNIGREGCRSIAKLLQNKSSKLRYLDLESNNIGDGEAEIIANSLKHNTILDYLDLTGNEFEEDGGRSFLKLLCDVSSVGSTYNSNHTLRDLRLPHYFDPEAAENYFGSEAAELEECIGRAIRINAGRQDEEDEVDSEDEEDDYSYEENPEGAGRRKVIAFQLDSNERMAMCRLQRIDYCYGSWFADSDPVLLPEILSIVGTRHGQNELYRMLIASVADLASIVNKSLSGRKRKTRSASF